MKLQISSVYSSTYERAEETAERAFGGFRSRPILDQDRAEDPDLFPTVKGWTQGASNVAVVTHSTNIRELARKSKFALELAKGTTALLRRGSDDSDFELVDCLTPNDWLLMSSSSESDHWDIARNSPPEAMPGETQNVANLSQAGTAAAPEVDHELHYKTLEDQHRDFYDRFDSLDRDHQELAKQRQSKKSGSAEARSIVVGSPRVYTRERLVNDRAEQDAWLRKVLEASESVTDFGIQGFRDRRTTRAFSSSTSANLDSGALDLYLTSLNARESKLKRDEQLAAIEHRIEMTRKLQELQELRQGDPGEPIQNVALPSTSSEGGEAEPSGEDTDAGNATAGGGETTSDSASTFDIPSNDPAMTAFFETLTNKEKSLLADPNGLVKSQAKGTPLDLFKDQLAYRDAIRTELFQNSLDDAHDLAGNTTYTLSFDLTVLSARKKNRWGKVEITVERPESSRPQNLHPLYEQWVEELNSYLNGIKRAWLLLLDEYALPPDLESELLHIAYTQVECLTLEQIGKQDPPFQQAIEKVYGEETPPAPQNVPPGDLLELLRSPSRTREIFMASLVLEELQIDELVGKFVRLGGNPVPIRRQTKQLELRYLVLQRDVSQQISGEDTTGQKTICTDPSRVEQTKPRGVHILGTTAEIDLEPGEEEMQTAWVDELSKSSSQVVTYAVTPREQADRISEVSSDRQALQILANLQALLPGRGGLKQAINYMSESQEISQALRRHPVIVGYSSDSGLASKNANFGWILGGRFGLERNRRWFGPDTLKPTYQHSAAPHNVSAIVSVPSWWRDVTVTANTFWLNKKESAWEHDGTYHLPVSLPGDVSGIAGAFAGGSWRFPTINKPNPYHYVRAGATARILVEGDHLWRSTMVTVGSQHSRNVVVLPNMRGIIATFDRIDIPPEGFGSRGYVDRDVYVWTSEGQVYAGDARIFPAKGPDKIELEVQGSRLLKDGQLRIALSKGKLPEAFDWLGIGVRGFLEGQPESMTDWQKIEVVVPDPGDPLEVKVSSTTLQTAMTIQAALIVRPRPKANEQLTRASGSLVYYATVADSQATIENWKDDLKFGRSIEIKMPKRWLAAYPGFKLADSKVTGKVVDPANNTTLTVKLDSLEWKDRTAGVFKGALASDTADAFHAFRCAQPVKIGWTLEAAGNKALELGGATALLLAKGPTKDGVACP